MRNSFFAKSYRSLLLLLYFSIMPVCMGSMLARYALLNAGILQNFSFLFLVVLHFLGGIGLALGLMPTTFYSLLAGYLFGWNCVPFLFFSYTLASVIGYGLCRMLGKDTLLQAFEGKYPVRNIISKLSESGISLAALCRLSPTLPFAILNALFAMAKFDFWAYFIGSFLGMIPRTLFAVYIGSTFSHITSVEDLKSNFSTWFSVILFFVSFAGIGWLVKRKLF